MTEDDDLQAWATAEFLRLGPLLADPTRSEVDRIRDAEQWRAACRIFGVSGVIEFDNGEGDDIDPSAEAIAAARAEIEGTKLALDLQRKKAVEIEPTAAKGARLEEASRVGNAAREAMSNRRIERVLKAVRDQLARHTVNDKGKYRHGVMADAFKGAVATLEDQRRKRAGPVTELETTDTVKKIWYENQHKPK